MADVGQIKIQDFADRDKSPERVIPVQETAAAELGAKKLLAAIHSKLRLKRLSFYREVIYRLLRQMAFIYLVA